MTFDEFLEGLHLRGIAKLFWEKVPEGGSCHTEGSVPWLGILASETLCMGGAGHTGTEGPGL